jgi:hypothetical protein
VKIDERLVELGLQLPEPSAPGANSVPFVHTGDLLFVTGQLSQWNGERRFIGKLGRESGVEEGQQAARLCALNVTAQLRAALDGDLDSDRRRPPLRPPRARARCLTRARRLTPRPLHVPVDLIGA